MSYKTITKESYQATAQEYTHNVADLAPLVSINRFVTLLPPHAKILDIGCGSGRDAKIFTDKGIHVVGVDFCANLIEIAKVKAPLAEFHVMDMEEISFPHYSFDGAWASASLLHLSKQRIPAVFNTIHSILKEEGYFYLSLKNGEGERIEKDARYEGNFEKFWSFFEEKELKKMLENANFAILDLNCIEKQTAYQSHPFLLAFCQKKDFPR